MDIEIVRRLCLARHLYELGSSGLKSGNDLFLFSSANLLQDAVEAFLVAISDHVHAAIEPNTTFDKYFQLINQKIAPKELPFRSKLIRLNRIRVDSKHYGILPARDECVRLSVAVREFFEEVSASILSANFATVSTIDLLAGGEVKELLLEAKAALDSGDLSGCAISCRKAIYLELEQRFDVSPYRVGAKPRGLAALALGPSSDAPYYAKNVDYIQKNVKDPADYIIYDHAFLEQELLKYAIDTNSFWNVWRLTPAVFRTESGEWVVPQAISSCDIMPSGAARCTST